MLNLHDALGRVKEGYRADLVLIAGKPDEQLVDLRAVQSVVIDGVVQEVEPPGLGDQITLGIAMAWAWLES